MITLQKQNIELCAEEIKNLINRINEIFTEFKSNKNKKKKVSFYDDDLNCCLILNVPDIQDFDMEMIDLFDYLSSLYGVANCKYDGDFLL